MDKKQLKSGFTTGTCAAVAAKAAAVMLLTGKIQEKMEVETPKGRTASMEILDVVLEKERASCAVRKDAGDDPDVTHGALVYAAVEYIKSREEACRLAGSCYHAQAWPRLYLTGGAGIGMVSREGLSCPVGMPAINPVPRQMILQEVGRARDQLGHGEEGLLVRISVPAGTQLAGKTFNPKLGILGGISILGTSGIVEPMSRQALLDTIQLEIHMKAFQGAKGLVLTPGNYGEAFLAQTLGLSLDQAVKCSNFIGDGILMAAQEGIQEVLLVGHVGKLAKVAAGARNTHSQCGDGRMESLWDCAQAAAGKQGADGSLPPGLKEKILSANTTEEALAFLEAAGIRQGAMEEVAGRIKSHCQTWSGGRTKVEAVVFSLGFGLLAMTSGALAIVERMKGEA